MHLILSTFFVVLPLNYAPILQGGFVTIIQGYRLTFVNSVYCNRLLEMKNEFVGAVGLEPTTLELPAQCKLQFKIFSNLN